MTYWHMQLSSKAHLRGRLKRILEENSFIDFADIEENKEIINKFRENVKVNDLILIKNRDRPIVLVQILESLRNMESTNSYQCKVKIIDWATTTMARYPLGSMTQELQAINPNSNLAYEYIEKWYKEGSQSLVNGIKIRQLYISQHKMFKEFEINFIDKNNKPLPIVVIVGNNGTGKTTLLEYIFKNHLLNIGAFYADNKDFIKLEKNNEIKLLNNEAKKKRKEIDDYSKRISEINGTFGISFDEKELYLFDLDKEVVYIKALENDIIKEIKKNILEFYRKESRELDSYSEALDKIRIFIKNIFDDLEVKFTLEDIDDISIEHEEVILKNSNGDIFGIENLSTGEKTLLSKILNLYFKNIKNQIVLIDEPELSLHPLWQNKIFRIYERFAKENNCQVIIATHSPNIIANTPHKYIKILYEENNKIVAKSLNHTPLDRDLNTIIKTIMGANYIPQYLEEKHEKYRNLCMHNEEDSEEAKKLKLEILEYESPNSSFFQGLAFDMELMR